jgi:hypothetical protein
MPVKPRRRGRAGDLQALKVEVWTAIRYLADTIENQQLPVEVRLRACSAMAVNAGVYRQLLAESDIEARLAAVEAALHERNGHAVAQRALGAHRSPTSAGAYHGAPGAGRSACALGGVARRGREGHHCAAVGAAAGPVQLWRPQLSQDGRRDLLRAGEAAARGASPDAATRTATNGSHR